MGKTLNPSKPWLHEAGDEVTPRLGQGKGMSREVERLACHDPNCGQPVRSTGGHLPRWPTFAFLSSTGSSWQFQLLLLNISGSVALAWSEHSSNAWGESGHCLLGVKDSSWGL